MTTIAELFAAAGVAWAGSVSWGVEVPLDAPGVYVVALTADADAVVGLECGPIDQRSVEELLRLRPGAAVDGAVADVRTLTQRLYAMWVPGEPAVYIGLAGGSVRQRINQFYATQIGARAPHSGGWPVKMLDQETAPLWVHYGATFDFDQAEAAMIDRFVRGVPIDVAAGLVDSSSPLPFANLTFPRGRRKRHGMTGVKESRTAGSSSLPEFSIRAVSEPSHLDVNANGLPPRATGRRRRTQNVTANDIKGGQVRIPSVSKDIFPLERGDLEVRVAGEWHSVRWDPRTTGNRSGVLRLGVAVMRACFTPGEPREIIEADGVYELL